MIPLAVRFPNYYEWISSHMDSGYLRLRQWHLQILKGWLYLCVFLCEIAFDCVHLLTVVADEVESFDDA